jgi:hypothetical protein
MRATQESVKAAAVQEQNRLLVTLQPVGERVAERR